MLLILNPIASFTFVLHLDLVSIDFINSKFDVFFWFGEKYNAKRYFTNASEVEVSLEKLSFLIL